MLVLVSYDVSTTSDGGQRRLRKVAKECQNFGQRVQNSVFECLVDPMEFADLKHRLLTIANQDFDSIRFYFLGSNWKGKIEHYGIKSSYDPEGPMII